HVAKLLRGGGVVDVDRCDAGQNAGQIGDGAELAGREDDADAGVGGVLFEHAGGHDGGREDIPTAVDKFNIQQIIIAIPSAPPHTIREIAEICTGLSADVKIMPEINKMLMNKPVILRDLDIHDFLSREEVTLDNETIADTIHGKRVLITGGGGSIGSEICRQIARFTPEELIIFDIYENNAYELQQELSRTHKELKVTVLIGSVRDEARLESVFNTYKPHIVFHAAAHKHVPLMEHSPAEAVKNNIFGTLNVAVASDKHNVSSFVLISTDKAVNPTNVMGATKRVAEMIIQHMNERSDTRFVAVRFGNVLGSNGSVVPLFQKQIESGGPVLVTHPDIVRFFMTIPEAAQLVLQACSMANGGEIFILDMGNPVKIDDLARKMITLSGNTPDVDIKIVYTGLRPGEKLYEELLLSEEGITATKHKKIYTAKPGAYDEELIKTVNTLNELISNPEALVSKIEEIIGQKLKH
ncbi:MAG: polysaccharide biosynthesis protein, partial [Clostridia bacterium]|nr:polysaccharide biosynthesis protein [Clostridia bacterium]